MTNDNSKNNTNGKKNKQKNKKKNNNNNNYNNNKKLPKNKVQRRSKLKTYACRLSDLTSHHDLSIQRSL